MLALRVEEFKFSVWASLILKRRDCMVFHTNPPEEEVIFRMTIRLRNGRVIRRANGRPFKIAIRK